MTFSMGGSGMSGGPGQMLERVRRGRRQRVRPAHRHAAAGLPQALRAAHGRGAGPHAGRIRPHPRRAVSGQGRHRRPMTNGDVRGLALHHAAAAGGLHRALPHLRRTALSGGARGATRAGPAAQRSVPPLAGAAARLSRHAHRRRHRLARHQRRGGDQRAALARAGHAGGRRDAAGRHRRRDALHEPAAGLDRVQRAAVDGAGHDLVLAARAGGLPPDAATRGRRWSAIWPKTSPGCA